MVQKRILDTKGKEFMRIQRTKTMPGVFDCYVAPEKTKTVKHSKPVKFKWWHAHRLVDETNLRRLQIQINQLLPKRPKLR